MRCYDDTLCILVAPIRLLLSAHSLTLHRSPSARALCLSRSSTASLTFVHSSSVTLFSFQFILLFYASQVPEIEYESLAPTTSSNRECSNITQCVDGEYTTVAPTTTSDRVCALLTVCSNRTFGDEIPPPLTDRTCAACTRWCSGLYRGDVMVSVSTHLNNRTRDQLHLHRHRHLPSPSAAATTTICNSPTTSTIPSIPTTPTAHTHTVGMFTQTCISVACSSLARPDGCRHVGSCRVLLERRTSR